jgi:hypothetical protein
MTVRYFTFPAPALLALFLVSSPPAGHADTVTLYPLADTTLVEVAPDNSLGGAEFFNAGTAGNGQRNRALFRFDLAGAIPAGAMITGGYLSLEVVRQPQMDQQNSIFSLRRMLQPWGEGTQIPNPDGSPGLGGPVMPGDANWLWRFANTAAWGTNGGMEGVDFSSQISSTAYVYGLGDAVEFENTPQILADLQYWLDNPGANFGWMMINENERTRKTARSFASRESGFGPALVIEFTPVPEPFTSALLLLAVGSAWAAHRRRA